MKANLCRNFDSRSEAVSDLDHLRFGSKVDLYLNTESNMPLLNFDLHSIGNSYTMWSSSIPKLSTYI